MKKIGRTRWVIPEGYIPPDEGGEKDPRFISHETACLLNAGRRDAEVAITVFFTDRDPAGPYHITVPAERSVHLRFNDLHEPEEIPRDKEYSTVIESSVPIVVQHTRLDSRREALSLLSTIAYGAD